MRRWASEKPLLALRARASPCWRCGLNEHGYIVPGLGDAGDRQFGTF